MSLTKSYLPIDTPPVEITTSASRALSNIALVSSNVSFAMPRYRGIAPHLLASAMRVYAFTFLIWPFTRLVHVLSAPLGYTTRPYVVYRSREANVSASPEERGWDPVSTGARKSDDARSRGA